MIWPILHPKSFVTKYLVIICENLWIKITFLKKRTQFFPVFSPKTTIPPKNEPKTNPIQTQTNPNCKTPRMNLFPVLTKRYEKPMIGLESKQTQNEPKFIMNNVTVISALGDNYIYLCRYAEKKAFVVDPGDASAVEAEIQKQKVELTHILLTHHHFDHTAGAAELKKKYGCEVITAGKSLLKIGEMNVEIIATPGHTKDSVCYYVSSGQERAVFTGDTLFVGGCGRPMECSRQVMWRSLEKLAALPDETEVYCGHNYTLDNYQFALSIEPENQEVKKCIADLEAGRCCVPSTIGREKKTNILLRAGCVRVKAALGMEGASEEEVFAELRSKKNAWG